MIALIDYGSGNVRSVFNALKSLGADVRLTADPAEISRADNPLFPLSERLFSVFSALGEKANS
jgi:imidazoleglycerol phosphate synthase glutamine amidotransferase subunit HisH